MNRLCLLVFAIFISAAVFSQENVVNWTFSSKKIGNQKYEVRLIASVDKPWHIYSTTQAEGGPVPTKISFTKNPLTTVDSHVKEVGNIEKRFEKVFGIDTKFFNDKVEFVQVVNVKGNAKTNAMGTIEFMVCNDQQCLAPRIIPFSVALK